jgi:hypothetical protein
LTKTVNFERALRLQELHRNSALGNAKKKAELGETEMERRAGDISEELASARAEGRRLGATVAALERIATLHDQEMLQVRKPTGCAVRHARFPACEVTSLPPTRLPASLLPR